MEGEYIHALNELTQKLLTRDININKFHGRENERLIEALNRNQQVPAIIPGTSAVSNSAQQQSLQAKMDTLTEKLDNIMVTQLKENKIAVYSETDKDGQPALMKRMQEMNTR